MSQSTKPITIQDVARAAGVSVSTVSRVLNDKDDVAPATYDQVKAVIAELGYASSLAAKSMRSRKTNVIGLVMPDLEEPFPIEVMKGVNRAIVEHDYDLLVYTNGYIRKNSSAAKERQYVSLLSNSITDGVIVVTPTATTFPTNSPIVAVDPNNEAPDYAAVIATNRNGALDVMDYLIQLGHRRIGFVGGRSELQSSIRREQGYRESLQQANIPIDNQIICSGDFSMESGYDCAKTLLTQANPPTAIFAANDREAFGVIKAAHELGLAIPDDLSVVGFDNVPEAAYYLPLGLTTVDQGVRQMGVTATEMLIALIEGKELDEHVKKISTQLIVRGSCRTL